MLRQLDSDRPDTHAIRADLAERLERRLAPLVADERLTRALVRSQLEDRHTPMLDRFDAIRPTLPDESAAALDALLADPARFVDTTMKLRTMESWERAFTIAYLSKHARCAVMGAADFGGWPINAERIGNVTEEEMPRVYSRSKLAMNVMRWQDDRGLNLKPFEITASGTACLCAHRAGLDELWKPGEEIASFEGPAQALETARELLQCDARRRAIAEAGRVRTLSCHTWAKRSDQIAAAVRTISPKPAAAPTPDRDTLSA